MFDRTLLPSPHAYYGQVFTLKGSKIQVLVSCCFHHDKSPSLSINLTKGTFNCLGCGAKGGDVLDFHKLKHGLNTIEAAKDLGAWIDTKGDTQDELAARKKKIADADKAHKVLLEQAAKAEIAHAQAFIPLLADILRLTTKPMFEPPYCVAKGIQSHTLLTIDAADIQRFTLPVDPHEPTKRPVTVCYGFEGVLTVAVLETLDGEQVALQVFDGVPDDKNKYARWLIGKYVVMGAYYRLGDWTSPSVVLITEGIADAISCYEATGYPVLAAISKSQLLKAAKAVKAKYPHNLIVICGDNDADGGGQRAANEAAKAVDGYVVIPEGVKDVNDLHRVQGLEAIKKMVDNVLIEKAVLSNTENVSIAEPITQATQAKEDTQKGTYFFLNEDNTVAEKRGVYFVGISKEGKYLPPMQVCGVLKIKAITRNQDHQEHGFLLEWLDRDNHKHYWSMPAELFKGDGADYRGQLLSCGLYIAPTATARMRLAEYIQNHHTPDRALCVDKTGWYQRLFVTPSHTYGKQSENEVVIYQSSQSFVNGYRQRGTLDEWRDKVAVLCVGNARLVFSICVAFAGSLLRLGHEESGGFHLRGNSSVGKSTGQHLACRVWGSRDYKQTWRATINGLEGIAALYNDGLLVLDEMAQADPKAIGETVYMLGNEQGKIRSQKSLIPRKNLSWKLLFLSSGELSLEQMMRDGGKKTKAGQEVRLVDIAADAGKRMGMVEQLNGFATAKELMDTLNRRTSQYYGVAGHAFLQAITQQPDEINQFLKDFKQRFIKANVQQGASEQVLRVASRFALVAAAGEMAIDEGITGWPKGEAYKAVVSCFNAWLEGRGGTGNQEVQAIKSQVRAFFEAHGESRFADWDDNPVTPRTVINRAGFRRKHENGDIYAVLPQVYSNDICAGFDVRTVNKVLIEAGWVEPDKDGKTQQRPYLPSIGRTRAYVFTTRLWQDDN